MSACNHTADNQFQGRLGHNLYYLMTQALRAYQLRYQQWLLLAAVCGS